MARARRRSRRVVLLGRRDRQTRVVNRLGRAPSEAGGVAFGCAGAFRIGLQSGVHVAARALRSVSREFPVLITGQLFFDASHYPCEGSEPHSGGHPARGSLWEIHPITDIQVCKNKTLRGCSPQDRTVWTLLHELPAHMMAVEAVPEMESEPDED